MAGTGHSRNRTGHCAPRRGRAAWPPIGALIHKNEAASGASRFESSYSLLNLLMIFPYKPFSSALKYLGRCPA